MAGFGLTMKILISNQIIIEAVPDTLMSELRDRLSFVNPKFLENDRLGYSNWNTKRVLKFYEIDNGVISLPRGFIRQLLSLCRREDVTFHIQDNRRTLPEVDFTFRGKLRPYQKSAVSDVLGHDFGVLNSPTGSGKTCMALYCISQCKQPVLIICHTLQLLNQWIDRIETFLGIPKDQVGVIGNGKKEIGEKVTVGIVNSVYRMANEISKYIGFLVVDECHRCPSRTFTEAVTAFDSKYMLALSATPFRRDGLSRLIYLHLGDQVHKVERDDLIEKGHVLPFEVISRKTNFTTCLDASEEYSRMLSQLTQDHERNVLITQDIITEVNNGGGICLVLSDRKKHCEAISHLLYVHGIRSELLTGQVSTKEREATIERLSAGLAKVVIATGQLIGEGFDSKRLSTLFLTTPIKFNGRVLQYLGRVLRPAPGKENARVYDYVDSRVGVLRASANARARVYEFESKAITGKTKVKH